MPMEDFRHRLNYRQVEYNEDAWIQMEALLNAQVKQDKKRRRIVPLILILLVCGILLVTYSTLHHIYTTTTVNRVPESENASKPTSDLSVQSTDQQDDNVITNSQTNRSENPSHIVNDDVINQKVIHSLHHIAIKETKVTEPKWQSENQDHKSLHISANDRISVSSHDSEATTIQNQAREIHLTTYDSSAIITPAETNSTKIPNAEVRLLPPLAFSMLSNTSHQAPDMPSLRPIKSKTHLNYLNMGAGYALLNTSKGYQIGLGLYRDQNKLIGFSSSLLFSRANGTPIRGFFKIEKQYDANLLLHMHLISLRKHNLSLSLGPGFSIYDARLLYWNNNDITYYNKYNYGLSYQGGLQYLYTLNPSTKISAGIHVISFDDAVTSFSIHLMKRL
jgi:hypothetical protein